jgi:hypothetical protein
MSSVPMIAASAGWVAESVRACVAVSGRLGPRLVRHAASQHRCRDAADDALVLAARRAVPLPRRVPRPLPALTLPSCARAFNALDIADRRALQAWGAGESAAPATGGRDGPAVRGAQREHLASAMARLVARARALEKKSARHRAVTGGPEVSDPETDPGSPWEVSL